MSVTPTEADERVTESLAQISACVSVGRQNVLEEVVRRADALYFCSLSNSASLLAVRILARNRRTRLRSLIAPCLVLNRSHAAEASPYSPGSKVSPVSTST